MRHGLGKINSETLKAEQINCQINKVQASSIHGDQRSICFLFMV